MYSGEQSGDATIIKQIKARDSAGLAAAYDRYGTVAYSVILRITRDESVAEDLVQELFFRLWNRIGDFDERRGNLQSWLLTIGRNIAIDHLRSAHSRFAARAISLDQTDSVPTSYKYQDIGESLDNSRTVQEAFSSLNSNQRKVLEMAFFQGFSQSEIARRLDEPLGTVKSWMRSALLTLRSVIEEKRSK